MNFRKLTTDAGTPLFLSPEAELVSLSGHPSKGGCYWLEVKPAPDMDTKSFCIMSDNPDNILQYWVSSSMAELQRHQEALESTYAEQLDELRAALEEARSAANPNPAQAAKIEEQQKEIQRLMDQLYLAETKLGELPDIEPASNGASFWSSAYFAEGSRLAACQVRLFTTPMGMAGQGFRQALTRSHTNIREGGKIPAKATFHTLYLELVGPKAKEMRSILKDKGLLQLDLIQGQIGLGLASRMKWEGTTGALDLKGLKTPTKLKDGAFGDWVHLTDRGIQISRKSIFAVSLSFGSSPLQGSADTLQGGDVVVRVTLTGRWDENPFEPVGHLGY